MYSELFLWLWNRFSWINVWWRCVPDSKSYTKAFIYIFTIILTHTKRFVYNQLFVLILIFIVFFCRVLKPPGGGSSDIFGNENYNTPRSGKNHLASNIFAAPEAFNKNGKLIILIFGWIYFNIYRYIKYLYR